MGPGDTEIRAITEADVGAWAQALDASFLLPVPRVRWPSTRSPTCWPGPGCLQRRPVRRTPSSLDMEVTVLGGVAVAAEGITNVAVVGSHRRRGLLSQVMRVALDDRVGTWFAHAYLMTTAAPA
jgi:hypothetical protein